MLVFQILMSLFALGFITWSIWSLCLSIPFGLKYPRQIFKGCLSNKEFDTLLYTLFTANDFKYNGFEVIGGGYTIWVANNYYGFKINDVRDFSLYQKVKFFRIWNKLKKAAKEQDAKKKLDVDKLNVLGSKNGFLFYGKD